MLKGITILVTWLLVGLLLSCKICADQKYIDFDGIEAKIDETVISEGDSLIFFLDATNFRFRAEGIPTFSFFSSAYAIDCDEGYGGLKYPITSFSIRSNEDFSDSFLVGSELGSLFYVNGFSETGIIEPQPITETELDQTVLTDIYLPTSPTLSQRHTFSIQLIRVNGDTMRTQTPLIVWE